MSQWTRESSDAVLKQIYQKAATDQAYRELCLSQPEEAIKQVTDQALPEGFKVRFVDNAGADATIVLPDFLGDGELSDAQLGAVVGGKKKKKKKYKDIDYPDYEYADGYDDVENFPSFSSYTFMICGK